MPVDTIAPGSKTTSVPQAQMVPFELLQMLRGQGFSVRCSTPYDRMVAECTAYNKAHGHVVPERSTESIVRAQMKASGEPPRRRKR